MIEESVACGVDAVKIQLYDTDKIKKAWQSRYFELKFSELNFEEAKEIKEHCDKLGIEFMASAFDPERVKWCEKLGVKRHKIASRSIRDTETIMAMERTKKPIIASLGLWNEIGHPNIKGKVDYLYCVSEYPAFIRASEFPNEFEEYSGFSDHTSGIFWAKEAILRGATIIEKHFTLNKTIPGCDQLCSAEPVELRELVRFARKVEQGNIL
jgi:N-acetylneuraminate synthase/N,N'-diacetyllegionaminate synthase